jgi:hypothetical protein
MMLVGRRGDGLQGRSFRKSDYPLGSEWSAHATDLIQWFQLRRGELRDTPFPLTTWTFVSVPAGFYAALARDIAQGSTNVRAEVLIGD